MAGHEAVRVLDQRAQEAALGRAHVSGSLHHHRIDPGWHWRGRAEKAGKPAFRRREIPDAAVLVQRIRGGRRGRGGKHDDPARERRPGGRLDGDRGELFEPIGFRENGGWGDDQRRRVREAW